MNHIVNRFLIFLYRVLYHIMYHKIHKHLIKFIKNYKYICIYIWGIFIINFEYIQLMTNLFITYIIIVGSRFSDQAHYNEFVESWAKSWAVMR